MSNRSTSLRNGSEFCAPGFVTERPAAEDAKTPAPYGIIYHDKAATRAALKQSLAAVVSTASSAKAGKASAPPLFKRKLPLLPKVAIPAYRAQHNDTLRSEHCRSASLVHALAAGEMLNAVTEHGFARLHL